MNRSDQLVRLSSRIRKAPLGLLRTEILAFLGFIQADQYFKAILDGLISRVVPTLGAYAGTLTDPNEATRAQNMHLQFADTPAKRAALGYQVLQGLCERYGEPDGFGGQLCRIGKMYRVGYPSSGLSLNEVPQCVDTFANVFLDPFGDYLTSSQERDDLILALMIRYKNRCEWFRAEQLLDIAERTTRDIERALKLDFYEYLFDHGVEFTIDPNSPSGGGEADVLSARFSDGSRLVLEAKVYDGKNRVDSEIKAGLNQAARYADQWLEPGAFLLVYNIASNTLLSFTGTQQQGNHWVTNKSSKRVFIVSMDLAVELPASQASQLKRVNIELGN